MHCKAPMWSKESRPPWRHFCRGYITLYITTSETKYDRQGTILLTTLIIQLSTGVYDSITSIFSEWIGFVPI